MSQEVRLQNLSDFTVQIRTQDMETIVGTGIVISPNLVITCAHVVESAIGVPPKEAGASRIGIYFPLTGPGERNARQAVLSSYFPEHSDDITSLRLIDGPAPLGPEQFAVLGSANNYLGHEFYSYGFSPTDKYLATWVIGRILGSVLPPQGIISHAGPIQLSSQEIDFGMSGSAVLDKENNLIIGLVAESYFPHGGKKGNIAYAVDAKVLTFSPFSFTLREDPLPLRPALVINIDVAEARAAVGKDLDLAWNNAPAPVEEWVGREQLLRDINGDWADSKKKITGLVGFGGEGKSSLARKWVDDLLKDGSLPHLDGVFWWGFTERLGVDEFFESALMYLSEGRIEPNKVPSTNTRAHIISAMLGAGRYLFILDGLEILQFQEGDKYGLLKNSDMSEFLKLFARADHQSFCLITSRIPLMDLIEYTTNTRREVEKLDSAEGRSLLQKLGVKDSDKELDKLVSDWEGHALTLSLIGGYLKTHKGASIRDIPTPDPEEATYEKYTKVKQILDWYDGSLDYEERAFLKVFSAFSGQVNDRAFDLVFKSESARCKKYLGNMQVMLVDALDQILQPLDALNNADFKALVQRLEKYRLLRHNPLNNSYTTHPLIREHYNAQLEEFGESLVSKLRDRISDYYIDDIYDKYQSGGMKTADLEKWIESAHQACQAGDRDKAAGLIYYLLTTEFVNGNVWENWEKTHRLFLEIFPGGDTTQHPSKHYTKYCFALCLMNLGKLTETAPLFEQAITDALENNEHCDACLYYLHQSELYSHLGKLMDGEKSILKAMEEKNYCSYYSNYYLRLEIDLLARRAWLAHLNGNLTDAKKCFQKADKLEKDIPLQYFQALTGRFTPAGIMYAHHLHLIGENDLAKEIAMKNLNYYEKNRWQSRIGQCHRVLADIDADLEHDSAREHYDKAIRIARVISHLPSLIETLLARGRWFARHMNDSSAAFVDLKEASSYATHNGYRIYEADIHVDLAWAHLAAGDGEKAKAEAMYAKQMSEEMGYYWGKKDAEEVLAKLGEID